MAPAPTAADALRSPPVYGGLLWYVDELLGGRRRGISLAVELDPRDYRLPDRTPIDPTSTTAPCRPS